MRIYLIGMPGSGKSTLGKKLAIKLGYTFIDMDLYIEQQACMFVDEIFEAYGESYFRDLETNILKDFKEMEDVVIATGGGVIKNKKNKELMDGCCIYLDTPLEDLKKRLEDSSTIRPLLQTKSVEQLYQERKSLYAYFADVQIENTNLQTAIEKICEVILK